MKRVRKPTLFYFFAVFFFLCFWVNLFSGAGHWTAVIWLLLTVIILGIGLVKNYKYQAQKQQDEKVYLKIRNYYLAALDDGKMKKTDINLPLISTYEKLPEEIVQLLAKKAVKSIFDEKIQEETYSGSLSPASHEKILKTAYRLDALLYLNSQVQNSLEKLRYYWSLEHETLPVIHTESPISKEETCHYQNACRWLEPRDEFSTVSGIKLQRVKSQNLKEIGRGNITVTNKRIILTEAEQYSGINIPSVLTVIPYSDGVGIEREFGKTTILMTTDPDILARILMRMINQNN